MDDDVYRKGNGLPDAVVRQAGIRGQDAMREARQRLVRGVRVDGRQAALMSGVEGLQEIKCFGTANLTDKNAVGSVAERRLDQVGDRDGRQRSLVAERRLCPPRFEAQEIRLS